MTTPDLDATVPVLPPELVAARQSIDNLDAALVHLLAERFKITRRVGRIKAERGLPPADPGREVEQIARLRRLAIEADLDPEFAEKFVTVVVREVVRQHESIRHSDVTGDGSSDTLCPAAIGTPT
jgi:chorismate mutase